MYDCYSAQNGRYAPYCTDPCFNVLCPPECGRCMPCKCPSFPPVRLKPVIPNFDQELGKKSESKIPIIRPKEKKFSKATKPRKIHPKSRSYTNIADKSKSREKLLSQQKYPMEPIHEEDEESDTCKKKKNLQDSCADFLTLVNETVCETVKESIESLLTCYFEQTTERLQNLCTQMVRNECLISKMYLDSMDRLSKMEQNNCEQLRSFCDTITTSTTENILAAQNTALSRQMSARNKSKISNSRRMFSNDMAHCTQSPSCQQKLLKERVDADAANIPKTLSNERRFLNPPQVVTCNDSTCPYKSPKWHIAGSDLPNQSNKPKVWTCDDNTCPYKQYSIPQPCTCCQANNSAMQDKAMKQNLLLDKYRKLANIPSPFASTTRLQNHAQMFPQNPITAYANNMKRDKMMV